MLKNSKKYRSCLKSTYRDGVHAGGVAVAVAVVAVGATVAAGPHVDDPLAVPAL